MAQCCCTLFSTLFRYPLDRTHLETPKFHLNILFDIVAFIPSKRLKIVLFQYFLWLDNLNDFHIKHMRAEKNIFFIIFLFMLKGLKEIQKKKRRRRREISSIFFPILCFRSFRSCKSLKFHLNFFSEVSYNLLIYLKIVFF